MTLKRTQWQRVARQLTDLGVTRYVPLIEAALASTKGANVTIYLPTRPKDKPPGYWRDK
jgi:hypothetical protein